MTTGQMSCYRTGQLINSQQLAIQQLTFQVIARMVFVHQRPPARDDCLIPESRGITRANHVIKQVISQSLAG